MVRILLTLRSITLDIDGMTNIMLNQLMNLDMDFHTQPSNIKTLL
jgi:hypothetical protein